MEQDYLSELEVERTQEMIAEGEDISEEEQIRQEKDSHLHA